MNDLSDGLRKDPPPAPNEAEAETGLIGFRRDRLLASLVLLFGLGLAFAAPWLHRLGRGATGWLTALLPLGLLVYFASCAPQIAAGQPLTASYP